MVDGLFCVVDLVFHFSVVVDQEEMGVVVLDLAELAGE